MTVPEAGGDVAASGAVGVAREAVAKAKAAGAKGSADHGKMSPALKALRDSAIIASLHAGMEVREVGREFGITPRSVQRIWAAFKLRPTALDDRPMEIVERVLRTYEQQMRDYARVAHESFERQPAVAISALHRGAEAHERYLLLLSDVGKLPSNLELFRSEMEMRRVGEQMVDALDRLEREEITTADVREVFERALQPQPLVWEAPADAVRELEQGDG